MEGTAGITMSQRGGGCCGTCFRAPSGETRVTGAEDELLSGGLVVGLPGTVLVSGTDPVLSHFSMGITLPVNGSGREDWPDHSRVTGNRSTVSCWRQSSRVIPAVHTDRSPLGTRTRCC